MPQQSNQLEFSGYASVFGKKDLHNEIFLHNAFVNSQNIKIPLLIGHNPNKQIGEIIGLKQDNYGLFIKARLDTGIQTIPYKGLSVGFLTTKDYRNTATGTRYIYNAILREVSLVKDPANPDAMVYKIER